MSIYAPLYAILILVALAAGGFVIGRLIWDLCRFAIGV